MNRYFSFFVLFLIFLGSVAAQPPFQSSENQPGQLSLVYPKNEYVKVNEAYDIHVHVYNSSGASVSDANCSLHLYHTNNSHELMVNMSPVGEGYVYTVNASVNDVIGRVPFLVWCVGPVEYGFLSGFYDVTKTGEYTGVNALVVVFSILGVVVCLLVLSFNLDNRHFMLKLLLIFFSVHLLILLPKLSLNIDDVIGFSFHKTYLGFVKAFWFYIITYFVYEVLDFFGKLDGLKNRINGMRRL